MLIQSYQIIPALRPYIKMICTMQSENEADSKYIRVLPDACVELFLNFTSSPVAIIGETLYHHSIATFRMSKPMDVQLRKGRGVIAICFHPGMAYRFIRASMHILSDTTTALVDIWGNGLVEIEDQLASAGSDQLRVNLVQKYLFDELVKTEDDLQIVYCLKRAQLSGGLTSVGTLATETTLSQRHLSRKFQRYVGLSPKEYLQVSRFIVSLDHLKGYPGFSLTEIAYKSGYYDQAHLIRDYKNYTGYTPGELLKNSHILY